MSNNQKKPNPMRSPAFIKMFKFSMIGILVLLAILLLYSCGQKDDVDYSKVDLIQYDEFEDDTPVAVFETNKGTYKAVLFPDETPEYYKFFTGLVKDGYYNDTYVCNVVEKNFFTGLTKKANGEITDDTNTTTIDTETNVNIWPFKGALLSYVGTDGVFFWKKNVAGSSVMFLGEGDFDDEEMKSVDNANEGVKNAFLNYRGVPAASQEYTIFGQVCDGWEVYNSIFGVDIKNKKDEDYQPIDDIKFTKVYMSTWGKEGNMEGTIDPKYAKKEAKTDDDKTTTTTKKAK